MTDKATTLLVTEIDGLSPFNARKSPLPEQARADLKASIAEKGVQQPLMVRREGKRINVLDGGSRYAVTRELLSEVDPSDALRVTRVGTVPVTWFVGTDAEASEASLISFVQRSGLHPVDEFERFVDLREKHGFDAERIARETGKGLRFVQERLRLSRLAPIVRDAWRKGEIDADTARAFSASESKEAQKATFKQLKKAQRLHVTSIRSELRRDHLRLDAKEMKYIGMDAYRAAGGRLDEQIFDEDSFALDAPLARQLAAEKLAVEGERIAAEEGWGIVIVEGDGGEDFEEGDEHDFAEEETRYGELAEINQYRRSDEQKAEWAALELRALLRAVPKSARASRAIEVELRAGGDVKVTRNLVRITDDASAADDDGEGEFDEDAAPRERATKTSQPAPPPKPETDGEPLRKGARAVLDETVNLALQQTVELWPSLALTYAVAAMGCLWIGGAAVDLRIHTRRDWTPQHPINAHIAQRGFAQALAHCAKYGLDDLEAAFGELVGAAIDTGHLTDLQPGLDLVKVAGPYAVRARVIEQFDAQAYFDASVKSEAVAALREMGYPQIANEAAGMKKPDAATRAALTAKDCAWLPKPLADAAPEQPARAPDTRTTAQAMADAIAADEAPVARDPFAAFLQNLCTRREGAKIKAIRLYQTYRNRMALESVEPMTMTAFGEEIAAHGVHKHRFSEGYFYLDITLADERAEAAQ